MSPVLKIFIFLLSAAFIFMLINQNKKENIVKNKMDEHEKELMLKFIDSADKFIRETRDPESVSLIFSCYLPYKDAFFHKFRQKNELGYMSFGGAIINSDGVVKIFENTKTIEELKEKLTELGCEEIFKEKK